MGRTARCGFTLQTVIIILAIFDLACEILGASLTCAVLVRVVKHRKTLQSSLESEEDQAVYAEASSAVALLSINLALYVTQIALCVFLLVGACQFSAAILFIAFTSVILNAFFGSQAGASTFLAITPQMLLFLYKGFMIGMVHHFIKRLRFSNNSNAAASYEDEYDQVDLN